MKLSSINLQSWLANGMRALVIDAIDRDATGLLERWMDPADADGKKLTMTKPVEIARFSQPRAVNLPCWRPANGATPTSAYAAN